MIKLPVITLCLMLSIYSVSYARELKAGITGTTVGVLQSLPDGEIPTIGVSEGKSELKYIIIDDRKETLTKCYNNNNLFKCSELSNPEGGYKDMNITVNWKNKKYWDGNIHPIAIRVDLANKGVKRNITIGIADEFDYGEGCSLGIKRTGEKELWLSFCSHGQKEIPGINKLKSMKNGIKGTKVKATWYYDNGEVFGEVTAVLENLEIIK